MACATLLRSERFIAVSQAVLRNEVIFLKSRTVLGPFRCTQDKQCRPTTQAAQPRGQACFDAFSRREPVPNSRENAMAGGNIALDKAAVIG
jgi:hypothetical protein